MKVFARSMLIAAVVEAPLMLALVGSQANATAQPWLALTWFHVIPLSIFTYAWMAAFGHGSPPYGPLILWHSLVWVFTYVVQVTITAAIVFPLVSYSSRRGASGSYGT